MGSDCACQERYYLAERHGAKLPQAFVSLQQQLVRSRRVPALGLGILTCISFSTAPCVPGSRSLCRCSPRAAWTPRCSPLSSRKSTLWTLVRPARGASGAALLTHTDCSQLNPPLFSLYIPCFTPARSLDADARETQAVRTLWRECRRLIPDVSRRCSLSCGARPPRPPRARTSSALSTTRS